MSTPLKVLHLEDNPTDSELVRAILDREGIGCTIDQVMTRDAFEAALKAKTYDVIVSDFSLPGFDGLAALSLAKTLTPEIPFIFLSGTIGEERAVESLKNGAADYVVKDRMQRLGSAIVRARNDAVQNLQRRDNEEQIRRQAELLNQAKDAIFVRNLDQEVIYWNASAERIYGWRADEIVGKRASELLYKPGAVSREQIWKTVLQKGEWTGELAQLTKSGKEIIVSSHRTLLRDSAGRPNAVLNINTDITDKKELEAQVLRSQRMDSIGALAGGIAHDLNNMLAPILMATELLQSEIVDEGQRRMLDTAKASAQRGAELVKQILQFARGSANTSAAVNLRNIVEEAARFTAKTFPPRIALHTDIDSDLPQVSGDPTQIHQVLLNLCVNARDAMGEAGQLLISVKNRNLADHQFPGGNEPASGPFVELSVSDTGSGIPPEILARIFDPFFSTKAPGKGTGLGLSTVATIVRNHKAFLEVESAVAKGTTFRIFFPATLIVRPDDTKQTLSDAPLGHGEWILLVDDERALLEMTREMLEASNYKVISACNGAEALRAFGEHREKIAVVITDLLMPELGGQELIANIRDRFPDTLTICLTGSTEDTTILHKRASGATAYLRKPCSAHDLLTLLNQLLTGKTRS